MRGVRQRLFQAFLTVIASFLLVSVAVFVANEAIISRYRMLTDNLLQEYQLVKRAEPFVTDYFSYTKAISDSGRRTIYENDRQAYLDGLAALSKNLTDKDSQLALAAVRNTVVSMLAEAEAAVREVRDGDLTKMSSRFDEVTRLATFVRETGTELVVSDLAVAARLNEETMRLRTLLDALVLSLLAIVTLGGVIFIFSFTRTIVEPLLTLVDFAKRAEKGDLTAQLPERLTDSDDETGTLARAFRQMVSAMSLRLKDLERAHVSTMAIVEGIPLGAHTYRLEEDGRLVFIATNHSASKILGPDHVKLIGQTLEEAFPGNVGTDIPEAYRRVAVTGVPFEKTQYSYEHGSISGVFELYAVQTAPQEVTVFFRDVTEKQRAEDMMRRSEAELKAAQAVAHVGSWAYEAAKGIPTFSDELRRMIGLAADVRPDVTSLLDRHVHPDDRAAMLAVVAELGKGKTPSPVSLRLVRADGAVRNVRLEFGVPKLDQQGRLAAASGVCHDITEQRTAEQALSDSERRYRTFVERTSDVIFATDITGRLTYVSPKIAHYRMTGEEVVGRNFLDFVMADDRARLERSFKKALGPGDSPEVITARLLNGSGEMFWIEESCSIQRDEHGQAIGMVGVLRDVTDHQLALMKLAESERRWRAFIENSKDVIFSADLKGTLTYVSPQIRRYGFDDETLVGQPLAAAVHPDDRKAAAEAFEIIAQGKKVDSAVILRLLAPNGTVTAMEAIGSLQTENDRPMGLVGVLRDVTARRDFEVSTRQSIEVERLFVRHSASFAGIGQEQLDDRITESLADLGHSYEVERVSIFLVSVDGQTLERRYTWFKPGTVPKADLSDPTVSTLPSVMKMLKDGDITTFDALDRPGAVRELARHFGLDDRASGVLVPLSAAGQVQGILSLVDSSGRHRWQASDFAVLRLTAELFGQVLLRQKGEQHLREADIILGFSSSVAFTWRHDAAMTVEYVSRNVLTLTGHDTPEFLSGRLTFGDIVHPDDLPRVKADLSRRIEDRTVSKFAREPYRLTTKEGQVKWVQDMIFIERDRDGLPLRIRGIIEDITARRAAEMKVTELDRLRQRFIHVVAHQLRTPLNSIRWSLESMLSGELGEMKKEQRDFVRVVYDAEIEIISRIHDMLTALDIEEGRVMVTKERVELLPLFNSVISEVTAQAKRRDVTVVTKIGGKTDAVIEADAEKLRFIAKALLQNAVVYSHDHGTVEVAIESSDRVCLLKVSDKGIGIPAAEQSSIFNRFFRASNASVVNQNASGLGLSIAKYYLERHGGRLTFESVEGQGTTFTAELPLA